MYHCVHMQQRGTQQGRQTVGTSSFDGADVDAECCVAVPDVGLAYRSLANGHAVRLTFQEETLFVCKGRVTCIGAKLYHGGGYVVVFAGDSMGYVYTASSSSESSTTTRSRRRFSTSAVRYCDAEYAATEDGCVLRWDAVSSSPKRRWRLRRLAPLVAATGKVADAQTSTSSTIRLVAVGGAAVACASTPAVAPGDSRNKSSAVLQAASVFKKLSSTAFGVVKTAFDQNARLGVDVVAYEGEDMDEVSALERETGEWNCAFVDAPRRYRALVPAGHGGWFATTDNLHRVILYRLVGDKIRVKRIIKGCRDATVSFSASSLVVHKPSIRALETYELSSPNRVGVVDVSRRLDVIRILPTADRDIHEETETAAGHQKVVHLLTTTTTPKSSPKSSRIRYRVQTLEDVGRDVF